MQPEILKYAAVSNCQLTMFTKYTDRVRLFKKKKDFNA